MRKKHSVVRASSMSRRRHAVKASAWDDYTMVVIHPGGMRETKSGHVGSFRGLPSSYMTWCNWGTRFEVTNSKGETKVFEKIKVDDPVSGYSDLVEVTASKSVKCSTRRRRSVKAASARMKRKSMDDFFEDELRKRGDDEASRSARKAYHDAVKSNRFNVILSYRRDSGISDDEFFNDWSDVESFAHEGLMNGLYVSITDMETGKQLEISPDEYQDAFDGDFDINEDIVRFKERISSAKSVKCSARRSIRAAANSGVMLKTETAEGTYYLVKSVTKKQTHWTENYDSANKFAKKDSAVSKLYSIISRLYDYAFYNPDDIPDIESEADLKKAKFAKFYITDLSGKTIEDISTEVKNQLLADDEFVYYFIDDFDDEDYDDEDDIEESTKIRGRRTIKASKDRPYLYVLKHGLGPGTLPRDVEIIKTDEYNGYTLVWLDRFLTTSELREYDIPSESNLERYLGEDFDRFSGVFSSRKVGRYIKASAYDGGDIVMFFNNKEIYRGQPGSYMYDAIYDLCKNDSVRMKFQEWLEQYGDSAFSDEPGYEYGDAGETAVEFCEFVYYAFADGEDYLDGEGILNFEIFPESDEAELFGDYKYGDIESSTVLSARDNTVDETAARKMVEAIVNDYELYPTAMSIIKNMQRKIKRGKYNADLAVKAWQYLADEGVAKYYKTKGALNPETRKAIAVGLRDNYEEEVNEGVEASEGLVTM